MTDDQGRTPSPPLCEAVTARGERCRARARPGRPLCVFHDPLLADARDAARRRGGQRTRSRWRDRLEEAEKRRGPFGGVLTALLDVVGELRDPALDPDHVQRLRACVYGLSVAARLLEVSELDAAVQTMNEKLSRLGVGGRPVTWPRAVGGYDDAP
jgi:hypothetical protein